MTSQKPTAQPITIRYISKEECNCPCIPNLMKLCKQVEKLFQSEKIECIISISFGKRVIVNTSFQQLKQISRKDFVEIIDFNPLSNTILIIAEKTPIDETVVHWFLHHAKKEIQITIQMRNINKLNKIRHLIPQIAIENGLDPLGKAKKWLKTLRNHKKFLWNDHLIMTASSLESMKDNLHQLDMELNKI